MHYYKSVELAELYGVSRRTVTNWIEQTQKGRLDLDLHAEDNKHFIVKSSKNQLIMKGLVQKRRKFLNTRSLKVVTPTEKFYKIFSEEQVIELITNIDTYREIPLKFTYFSEGAKFWNEYATKLYNDSSQNTLTSTIQLLKANISYIDTLLARFKHVNVIDVGVGNAVPTRDLLAHLLENGKLNRYVGLDLSEDMLKIAKTNIDEWFGGKIVFEGYLNDVSSEPFIDIIAKPTMLDPPDTVNLFLIFGGTFANFRDAEDGLRVVCKSMSSHDLVIYVKKLDSSTTREHLYWFADQTKDKDEALDPQCKFLLDTLGITPTYYNPHTGFDTEGRSRYLDVKLKYAINLDFQLPQGTWRIKLNKDDSLTVWRAWHNTAFDVTNQLYTNGFNPLLTAQTPDHDYMLVLADLRRDGR